MSAPGRDGAGARGSGVGGSASGVGASGVGASGVGASGGGASGGGASGADLVREALDRARAAAAVRRAEQADTARVDASRAAAGRRRAARPRGPRRDPGDPVPFGEAIADLLDARGWEPDLAVAGVLARWDALVGPEIAAHCTPESLTAGVLVLQAESTAWATQLRLLSRTLIATVERELGHGVVTELKVHGPTGPTWTRGARRVKGRGPRDTYG